MTNPTPLHEIALILRNARRVLALTHIAPDGDAIGSLLGFGWVLDATPCPAGKREVVLVALDGPPSNLSFLPGVGRIRTHVPAGPWDAVVALDASDPARLGEGFVRANFGPAPLLVIDHHVTNLRFGSYNYIGSEAATAQIIVALADELNAPIRCEAATCLLTGIVTDTRGFRTSNTTIAVMSTAARLMASGAPLAEITERTLNYMPLAMMRLWGPALTAAELRDGVIWARITPAIREVVGAPENGDHGLASFLLSAPEAHVSAVFNEKSNGQVEIGFRSVPGYDVSAVALNLGGGGHPQAAGCTLPGPLADVEARVLSMLLALRPSVEVVAGKDLCP